MEFRNIIKFFASSKAKIPCNCLNFGICENSLCYCLFPFIGDKCENKVENSKLFYFNMSKYFILTCFFLGFIFMLFFIHFFHKYNAKNILIQKKKESGKETKNDYQQISHTESEIWKII